MDISPFCSSFCFTFVCVKLTVLHAGKPSWASQCFALQFPEIHAKNKLSLQSSFDISL